MSLLAGTKLGPYEIVAPLGAGGMGEVYRARDAKLGRDVAIKVLPEALAADRAALERLEREAQTLAATSHPNILSIFDFGTSDRVTYAVMELLEGDTIRTLLTAGPLSVRKAVDYAIQIAQGLGSAHDRGIIHRDLKPENLFVTRDGRVKILDFGLARQHVLLGAADATLTQQTEPGTVLGTIGYMSPEQVQGKPADARSDIFSFGAVLYEMVAGRRAFKGDSAAETMHAILRDDPPDLQESGRNLPAALDRIVAHCLEKSPDLRFQSARDVAFNLGSVATLSGSGRGSAALPAVIPGWSRGATYGALVVVGALAGGLAGWMLKPAPVSQSPTFQRLTFDRGMIWDARFAPDGQTIVYDAQWRGLPSEIFTTRLGSRESRPLGLGSASLQGVSSASELAVGLGSLTVGRVPLAGGAPRAALERVSYSDWSPDGAELAIVRVLDAQEQVEFPAGKVIYRTSDTISHLRVSPDGDWVAFAEHFVATPYGTGSLVAVNRAGTKRVLSKGWSDVWGVAWGPDGREAWFTAARHGEYKALRAVSLDGRERLVTRMIGQVDLQDVSRDGRVLVVQTDFRIEMMARAPGAPSERPLSWLGQATAADLTSDGSRVLFGETMPGGGASDLTYLRPTDGGPPMRLGEGGPLALSPDGAWALVLAPPSDHLRLAVLPTGAGEPRYLTRPGFDYSPRTPAVGTFQWAVWLHDGSHVIFNARQNGGPLRLFVQDIVGGDPQPVGPEGLVGQAVSPDGKSVVGLMPGGRTAIYPLAGGDSTPCAGLEKDERPIRWSSDGRSLICRRDHGLVSDLSAIEISTGRRRPLWQLAPADLAGASAPIAVTVTPDGKSYAYSFYRNIGDLYLVEGLK